MDRLNLGSEDFTALDLTTAAAKAAPAGGIVLTYTNTLGRDIQVIGDINIDPVENSAATFTLTAAITLSPDVYVGFPILSAAKVVDTTTKICIPIPEMLLVDGAKVEFYVHSSNAGDDGSTTVNAGKAYLCEVQTGIDVISVGGATPESLDDPIVDPTPGSVNDEARKHGRY